MHATATDTIEYRHTNFLLLQEKDSYTSAAEGEAHPPP